MKVSYILCFWMLIGFLTAAHAQTVLTINSRHSPPNTTIFQAVILEAFQRNGIKIDFQILPLGRALSNVNAGLDDGDGPRVAGLHKTYPDLVLVPEKVTNLEIVAFTKGPTFVTNHWSRLAPYSVAFIRGTKVLEAKVTKYISLNKVNDIASLFQLLKKDRVDVVLASRLAGLRIAKKLRIEKIKIMEPPLISRGLFLYLHKKHQPWVPVISKTLKQMKQEGTYTKIVKSLQR